MEISFTPSPDVATILNALLDKFENRAKRNPARNDIEETNDAPRAIKIILTELPLPSYFSQTDPEPRLVANRQLQELAKQDLIILRWLPGETNHILQSTSLANGKRSPALRSPSDLLGSAAKGMQHEALYTLLRREPLSNNRARLESLLLAEKFRFERDDWRARALDHILDQLRAEKSPSPFSLSDSDLNLDLLAVLRALPTLTRETPYRVFSVRLFNDTKRFDDLKPSLLRLARRANPEWKSLTSEDLLRELNLAANPGYVQLAGNWEFTDINGQIIGLAPFTPSVGFPASQITSLQKITIRAESVLCIENLTSFHQYTQMDQALRNTEQVDRYTDKQVNNRTRSTKHDIHPTPHAVLCLMGNPSPSIRHLLRLIPEDIPIYLWSDMDYGGFNILSQLRRQVGPRIQSCLMDITTFEKSAHLSRPLTQSDVRNLKRLLFNSILKDIHPTIEHILKRGLKLEQEAIQI
jgi:hypothetical protein